MVILIFYLQLVFFPLQCLIQCLSFCLGQSLPNSSFLSWDSFLTPHPAHLPLYFTLLQIWSYPFLSHILAEFSKPTGRTHPPLSIFAPPKPPPLALSQAPALFQTYDKLPLEIPKHTVFVPIRHCCCFLEVLPAYPHHLQDRKDTKLQEPAWPTSSGSYPLGHSLYSSQGWGWLMLCPAPMQRDFACASPFAWNTLLRSIYIKLIPTQASALSSVFPCPYLGWFRSPLLSLEHHGPLLCSVCHSYSLKQSLSPHSRQEQHVFPPVYPVLTAIPSSSRSSVSICGGLGGILSLDPNPGRAT